MHQLLQEYEVKKGEQFNFTYMAMPYGSFMVPEDKRDEFYKAYTDTVNAGIVPPLTEKQGLAGPVVVDLDFKFTSDVKHRCYTPDLVESVVSKHFDILGEYVQLDEHNNMCYIFERASPYLEEKPGRADVVKDGLHLMFPAIKCFDRLKWMARDHVIQECRPLFEKLGTTNTVDDIVDKAVISTNNWFVYLSSKPNCQPYKLTRVLDNALKDVAFTQGRKLVPFLSVAGDFENVAYTKELPPSEPSDSVLAQRNQPTRTGPQLDHQQLEDQQHDQVCFTLLQQAVMGLQDTRAEGYENCFKVICGINNISHSNNYEEEGQNLIHEFSQKSVADYDANDVNKKLSQLLPKPKGPGVGFGTIKDLLKEDNLELYQQLFTTRDQLDIAISNGGQHLDIAEVFSSLFPGQFVWATTTKDTMFYRFTSTVWERQEDDAIVFKLLSQEVWQAFVDKVASFEAQIEGEQDLAIKEQQEKKAATTSKIAHNLRSMPYIRQVYAAITKQLYNASFMEQLDTNLDLLAFKDGVYDLSAGNFRKGKPDDMLSVCVPYNFPTHDPQRRQGLLTFLSQIKPEDDERQYLVDQLSQCLSGRIKKQLVHILAGPLAGNGKSTLFSLISLAFGDYFCTMDITYLTQKSAQANNANPILIDVKRARIVGLSEPEEGARFNGAILKALSGGDEQKGRALFSNKLIRYHPQFRLFILCNDTPNIDGKDRGLARRIRKINFASQFTDIKEPDLQNHIYPINVDMSDMLQVWAPELMVLLLEHFSPDYVYSCPSSIQQGSEEYMQENDPVRRFVQDNLQKDAESVVTLPDLRELPWNTEEYGRKPERLCDFKKDLIRVLGTDCLTDKRWKGKKYKSAFVGFKVIQKQILTPDCDGEI